MATPDLSPVTVRATLDLPLDRSWTCWTEPEHVCAWNAASPEWHSPRATNDLRVGGRFSYRMEARDGSMGFDFEGTYTRVVFQAEIAYTLDDGREVAVTFAADGGQTTVTETFDPETVHPREFQQVGWQAILDNFKRYAESR